MGEALHCWKCGAAVDEPLPLSRRAECRGCRAELHVCRMCKQFDANVARQCREDRAEDVTDKAAANFCDWFEPNSNVQVAGDGDQSLAQGALAALFGEAGDNAGSACGDATDAGRSELDDLFGKD